MNFIWLFFLWLWIYFMRFTEIFLKHSDTTLLSQVFKLMFQYWFFNFCNDMILKI
jgi:hypothetical protein